MYFCAKAVRKIAGNVEQFCSTMHVSYIKTMVYTGGLSHLYASATKSGHEHDYAVVRSVSMTKLNYQYTEF